MKTVQLEIPSEFAPALRQVLAIDSALSIRPDQSWLLSVIRDTLEVTPEVVLQNVNATPKRRFRLMNMVPAPAKLPVREFHAKLKRQRKHASKVNREYASR